MGKQKKNKTQNNYNKPFNAVPNLVFTPFRTSKNIIIVLNCLIILISLIFGWNMELNTLDLKELAQFIINIVLVMGTIGITIFAMPCDEKIVNSKENRHKVLISYIGTMGVAISIAFLGYVISILDMKMNDFAFKAYYLSVLFSFIKMLTTTFASIVAHFNIRD